MNTLVSPCLAVRALHRLEVVLSVAILSLGYAGFGQVYEKVFSFADRRISDLANSPNKGRSPDAGLVEGKDGNFYGVTASGGATGNNGTIFRVTPAGVLTTLVEFTYDGTTNRGAFPEAAMIQARDGNFYGTTRSGGIPGAGTVFKLTTAGVLTTLVEFDGFSGSDPRARLLQARDGNFYGTTSSGGASSLGTVFQMTPTGALTTLVSFTGDGASNKGSVPLSALVEGSDGNFYGTTSGGGTNGLGTIFKMTPDGTLTTLVSFTGNGASNKGAGPGGLVLAGDGNFYGTTEGGGATGNGTVFKMTPAGALSTLVEFTDSGPSNKGSTPHGALVQGADGNFYGTTEFGGVPGSGTVFKVSPAGVLTTLAEFTDNGATIRGARPLDGVVLGSDGLLYGTTHNGGVLGHGTVFKISPSGSFTTLVEFTYGGQSDVGTIPVGGLVPGADGELFGTTYAGGLNEVGTVFKMTAAGDLTTLKAFARDDTVGDFPETRLLRANDGTLYGTTSESSPDLMGTIFKMTAAGDLTTLVTFSGTTGAAKGDRCKDGLIEGSDGNLYGTTQGGGANGLGTVFRVSPAGSFTTLVEFTGNGAQNKGSSPVAGLVEGSDGSYYGTTGFGGANGLGTVFKMTSAGVLNTLVSFTGNGATNKGAYPYGALVQGGDGNFYGTTNGGGSAGYGTVFKMSSAGTLTTLAEFTYGEGAYPIAGLAQAGDGNFYGTTTYGGANDLGTIFKVTPGGVLTTVFSFVPDPISARPTGALALGGDGNLYGVASNGPGNPEEDSYVFRVLLPGAPSVFLVPLSSPALDSAIVKAQVNPRGASTSVSLEFGTDGVTFPNSVAVASLVGSFQSTLTGTTLAGLQSGTRYTYRFRAVSSAGTTVSAPAVFSTLAEPVASATAASEIAPTSARFHGVVNARGFDTMVAFEWGTDGNAFPNTTPATPGTVSGNADVPVAAAVAGLVRGQTYFYRIVATNAAGTVVSGTQSFITLTDPVAVLGGVSAVGTVSARVGGTVNARGASTAAAFEFGTDGVSFPNSTAATPSPVEGTSDTAVSAMLTSLTQGTTYFFRIKATSAGGEATTSAGTFTTLSLPTVNGQSASEIGSSTATLNATVDANGLATSVVFEYGPGAASLPFSVTASPGTVTGDGATVVSAAVSGLVPETSYFFRVRATSAAGEAVTSPLNFIMSPSARAVTGVGSAQLGASAVVATFNGTVNGFGQPTSVSFDYGTSAGNLNQSVGATPGSVSGASDTTVAATVSGLAQNTTYFFRVKASNGGGTTMGAVQSFTTPTKTALAAQDDYIFYSGAILIDPLRNDEDPDAVPAGDKSRLFIDPVLVQPPTVSTNVATVSDTRKTIGYSPQFNVKDVDTLIYKVTDGFGGVATPMVSLITFQSRAGFYGGAVADSATAPGRTGTISLLLSGGGAISSSFANWAGETYRLKGVFDQFGELRALFTSSTDPRVKLTLTLALGHTSKTIIGSLVERTDDVETARVDDFNLTLNAGTGGLPEPGLRTAFLTPPGNLAEQMGDGYVLMNVAKNKRSARFAGQLPDGEPFSGSASAQGRTFSLSRALESGGLLTGLVRVIESQTDAAGMMANLFWRKRPNSRARYHRGAIETQLELQGMEYPALARGAAPPIDLGAGSPNARLSLNGGDLASALDFPLYVSGAGVRGFDSSQLRLKLQPQMGTFSGSFKDPATNRFVPFRGAFRVPLDTEPGQGRGVFRGASSGGTVRIIAP